LPRKKRPQKIESKRAPAVPLTLYQKAWIEDGSRFKIARICRQGGKSFAGSLEATLDSNERKKNMWILLSRGERQSKELIRQVKMHSEAINIAVEEIESLYRGEETEYKMLETIFPNGSRIVGLPANPDTARGWSANVLLDEFALHMDSRAIWRALYPTITRGFKIRILSTPFGKKNKFYELFTADNGYSKYTVPIGKAVAEGLELRDEKGNPTTVEELKRGFGDDEGWAQEYEVEFIDEATAFITYELIGTVESDQCEVMPGWATSLIDEAGEAYRIGRRTSTALIQSALGEKFDGHLYVGFDVARKRDLSVIWVDEIREGLALTRAVIELARQPFFIQKRILFAILAHPNMRRACIDQSGLGMQMAEEAIDRFGTYKVEGIDFTAANKEALATGLKQAIEDIKCRIPISQAIRNSIHSVKKYQTSTGHFRFDADRTEETGHADHFWAKALATQAASQPAAVIEYRSSGKRESSEIGSYLPVGKAANY